MLPFSDHPWLKHEILSFIVILRSVSMQLIALILYVQYVRGPWLHTVYCGIDSISGQRFVWLSSANSRDPDLWSESGWHGTWFTRGFYHNSFLVSYLNWQGDGQDLRMRVFAFRSTGFLLLHPLVAITDLETGTMWPGSAIVMQSDFFDSVLDILILDRID